MSIGPMNLWQVICYGNNLAAVTALAYYRARGWAVDSERWPERDECENLLYAFIGGFEAGLDAEWTREQAKGAKA